MSWKEINTLTIIQISATQTTSANFDDTIIALISNQVWSACATQKKIVHSKLEKKWLKIDTTKTDFINVNI